MDKRFFTGQEPQTNKQKTFDVIKNKGIKVKNSMRQHLQLDLHQKNFNLTIPSVSENVE